MGNCPQNTAEETAGEPSRTTGFILLNSQFGMFLYYEQFLSKSQLYFLKKTTKKN